MNTDELSLLVDQVRYIILNKPIPDALKTQSPELGELQEALQYLSECLLESNSFLSHLQRGDLDVTPPSRHNFLAGNLKEIHSALKHLTWQANQVANGDYTQCVNFLGDFSASFNRMIEQLAERESQLKIQSTMLSETVNLMKSVMDSLREWILVTSKETGEVIYTNKSARQSFYNPQSPQDASSAALELLNSMRTCKKECTDGCSQEYHDPINQKVFRICSYSIQWNGNLAYAHLIADVTSERARQEQMEGLAYLDELTGLYNRRYLMDQLRRLLEHHTPFSFCMIDLDGLKYANNEFGHEAGDHYLKTVTQQMLQVIRTTDIACRIGGDEFALLLPDCDEQTVLSKLERVDQALAALSQQFPMSVSYGVVQIQPGDTTPAREIMKLADEKMYLLKKVKKAARRANTGLAPSFEWMEELETGNQMIDSEHKMLLQLCSNLLQSCAAQPDWDTLHATICFLQEYIKTHFQHEEHLQRQSDYPDYPAHRHCHETFIRTVEHLSNRLEQEGATVQLTTELNQCLCSWMIHHIKIADTKFAYYLSHREQKLPAEA